MGERAIDNRIKKLREIERQQADLQAQAEKIREEIKAEMKANGKSEIHTPNAIIRLKEVITNRFDSKSFKQDHKKLYKAYTKPQTSIRFTIA